MGGWVLPILFIWPIMRCCREICWVSVLMVCLLLFFLLLEKIVMLPFAPCSSFEEHGRATGLLQPHYCHPSSGTFNSSKTLWVDLRGTWAWMGCSPGCWAMMPTSCPTLFSVSRAAIPSSGSFRQI